MQDLLSGLWQVLVFAIGMLIILAGIGIVMYFYSKPKHTPPA